MENQIANLAEHRLLKFEAAREGLGYSDYRMKLRLHGIPLDVAIENVKNGISVKEYVQHRRDVINRARSAIYSMIAVSLIGMFSASITDHTPRRYEKAHAHYTQIKNDPHANRDDLESALRTLETEELYTFGFSRT